MKKLYLIIGIFILILIVIMCSFNQPLNLVVYGDYGPYMFIINNHKTVEILYGSTNFDYEKFEFETDDELVKVPQAEKVFLSLDDKKHIYNLIKSVKKSKPSSLDSSVFVSSPMVNAMIDGKLYITAYTDDYSVIGAAKSFNCFNEELLKLTQKLIDVANKQFEQKNKTFIPY